MLAGLLLPHIPWAASMSACLLLLCRELWHRASLAWQQTLNIEGMRCALVVAHNAVNQPMIATATGLPPSYFRRLLQSNGATTVLDFRPQEGGPPSVTLDRLNQARLLLLLCMAASGWC